MNDPLNRRLHAVVLALCLLAAASWPTSGAAADETALEVKRTSEQTVETDIQTQEAMAAWLVEKRRLLSEIDQAAIRLKRKRWRLQKVATYRENLEKKVVDLRRRAAEMETIQQELLWVLDRSLERLGAFVEKDAPYNRTERGKKLLRTERIVDDYDMGLASKTRAVFDALAREVDVGHTVEARDAEITVDGRLKSVKMMRVGRIGLYALTMDARSAWWWSVEQGRWLPLADGVRPIEEALEMAEGSRIIGLSRLPLGRPVQELTPGGDAVEEN